MTYSNKHAVGEVVKVISEETYIINHDQIKLPVNKGDIIFKDLSDAIVVIDQDYFYENFIEVELEKPKKAKRKLNKSPFELEQIAEAYGNVGDYIERD